MRIVSARVIGVYVVCLLWLFPVCARSQTTTAPPLPAKSQIADPTAGGYSYHQLRTSTALSGSMFGVDNQGYISLGGPVAYSTPVANTLGHGKFVLDGDQYSFQHELPVFTAAQGNWNFALIYGFTVGRFNVSVSANCVDLNADTVWNFEIQYIPSRHDRLTFAIGGEDIFDATPTVTNKEWATGMYNILGEGTVPDNSYFGVATYSFGTRYSVNFSTGVGTGRFRAWFDSVSVQVAHPLRLWAENDGYGVNAGALYWVQLEHGKHAHGLSILMGNAKMAYFLFGMGITL